MGSCISSSSKQHQQQQQQQQPEDSSDMKFGLPFVSKTNNHLIIPSPVKQKSLSIPVTGSKDETFFDSNVWLDSDCDDDFMSVNGEFTPSRGNTPVHHNFTTGAPRVDKTGATDLTPNGRPEPSPTDKKHRLSDLFKESLRAEHNEDEQNTSGSATPYASSFQSSERTPNGNFKVRSLRSIQCCLPSLRSSSFNERKKKMSPVGTIA
ncbi:Triacylglycerol lipase 2-like [Heracleum sosnowskyi]|uniref:Triacylglycerol lipase 2-like n=1 Tax=Heracleum sosnowskyi TaxID=360622 RepID=A0AAD8H1S0_9APIA|nr:Triacylglycerol lipase 2-like [Heracleum sosnowskyi]